MYRIFICAAGLVALIGCDAKIERFESNELYSISLAASRRAPATAASEDAARVTQLWFGTPNEPAWPSEWLEDEASLDLGDVVDRERLRQAAGPVSSVRADERTGLYRQHCVVCHGVEGSGAGAAAIYQDPYPRDFRHGIFKWKSTERSAKPTREDLREVLVSGLAGTAMPSFSLLKETEIESLVDYVIYLSIRGEVERRLAAAAIDELDYHDSAPDDESLRLVTVPAEIDPTSGQDGANEAEASAQPVFHEVAIEVLREVVGSWSEAESRVVVVPGAIVDEVAYPGQLSGAIQRGREIFHGAIANCAGCHGPSGRGGLATQDYDDWTKEFTTRIGLTPGDKEQMRPMRKAGALPPRIADPRVVESGEFRGGSEPSDLYRRITQGIAGTPMPGVSVTEQASAQSLSYEQARDLIFYVRSLGGESHVRGSAKNVSPDASAGAVNGGASADAGSDSVQETVTAAEPMIDREERS